MSIRPVGLVFMKLMDLFDMTHRAQVHEFYKNRRLEELFIFQATVLKFGDLSV